MEREKGGWEEKDLGMRVVLKMAMIMIMTGGAGGSGNKCDDDDDNDKEDASSGGTDVNTTVLTVLF